MKTPAEECYFGGEIDEARSLVAIACREVAKLYITRLTKLAFVSPGFADAIVEGEVPPGTNLQGRLVLPQESERS